MKEPISTITSLLFIAAGIAVATMDSSAQILASFSVILGVASSAHHASGSEKNTPAHLLDEWAIYGILTALFYHAWFEIVWVLIGASALLALSYLKLREIDLFKAVPAAMIAVAAGVVVAAGPAKALIVTLIAVIALFVRSRLKNTDLNHGIWHALAAIDIPLTFYFLS